MREASLPLGVLKKGEAFEGPTGWTRIVLLYTHHWHRESDAEPGAPICNCLTGTPGVRTMGSHSQAVIHRSWLLQIRLFYFSRGDHCNIVLKGLRDRDGIRRHGETTKTGLALTDAENRIALPPSP